MATGIRVESLIVRHDGISEHLGHQLFSKEDDFLRAESDAARVRREDGTWDQPADLLMIRLWDRRSW